MALKMPSIYMYSAKERVMSLGVWGHILVKGEPVYIDGFISIIDENYFLK